MPLLKIPLGPWDITRQIRRLSMYTHSRLQSKSNDWRDIYVLHSHCLPSDLDENNHMNNARYLREADMARQNMWFHNGIMDAMYKRKLANPEKRLGFVLASSSIRYRHEIYCWTKLIILCRIIGWDSKTFYVETIFTTKDSNNNTIINAYMIGAQQPVGVTPGELMKDIGYNGQSPKLPEHVELWMKAEASNRKNVPKNEKALQDWLKKYGGHNVHSSNNNNTQSTNTNATSTTPTSDRSKYVSQLAVVTTGTDPNTGSNNNVSTHTQQLSNNITKSSSNNSSNRVQQTVEDYDQHDDGGTNINADEANIIAELEYTDNMRQTQQPISKL